MRHLAIPVVNAPRDAQPGCGGGESFALMVLGDSMRPEFEDGDVVVIEPDGLATDGSFVLARHDGEWMLRRLARREGGWTLHALNAAAGQPDITIADLAPVAGVVIQKSRPGRRRSLKRYVA
jgi:SOS-response transcriptional repressor LexA